MYLFFCDDMRKVNGVIVWERYFILIVDKIFFFFWYNVCILLSRIGWWIYIDCNFCYWYKGNDVWGKLWNWYVLGSNLVSFKILWKCEKYVCDDIIMYGWIINEYKRRFKKVLERI